MSGAWAWHHVEHEDRGMACNDECMLKFTETECRIGTGWMFKTADDDPKISALLDWLVFHGFDPDDLGRIVIGIDFSIKRDVENCRVIWVGPRSAGDGWPTNHYLQGETPPLPWPGVLMCDAGYTSTEPQTPDLGMKEKVHEHPAQPPAADGGQQRRRLRLADDHPDRPGDHRADHLDRADGHRPSPLAPVTLDALGDSPLVGGLG